MAARWQQLFSGLRRFGYNARGKVSIVEGHAHLVAAKFGNSYALCIKCPIVIVSEVMCILLLI